MAALGDQRPVMVLMKGHPGTGKSTLARLLCRALRCPLADKDDARDAFHEAALLPATVTAAAAEYHDTRDEAPSEDSRSAALGAATAVSTSGRQSQQGQQQPGAPAAPSLSLTSTSSFSAAAAAATSSVDWNALSYDVMFRVAGQQLRLGFSVVVDCPLAHRRLYDRAVALAQQCGGAAVAVVECMCSDEGVWRRRLEARGQAERAGDRGHKPSTWDQVQELLARYDGCWRWSTDGGSAAGGLVLGLQHYWAVDTSAAADEKALHAEACRIAERIAALQLQPQNEQK